MDLNMNISIKKAETVEMTKTADELLTKLIRYESGFNKNINENYKVKDFYQNRLDENSCIAIAYNENSETLGYIYGYINTDNIYVNPIACIDAIYIKEKYRENHILTKLVDYFINWAKTKDCNEFEISVLSNNKIAFEIYKHLGFKVTKYTMNKII